MCWKMTELREVCRNRRGRRRSGVEKTSPWSRTFRAKAMESPGGLPHSSLRGQYTPQVGTGTAPSTIPFLRESGFAGIIWSRTFSLTHYDHPIYECGVKLVDMVYLQRTMKSGVPAGHLPLSG